MIFWYNWILNKLQFKPNQNNVENLQDVIEEPLITFASILKNHYLIWKNRYV